MDKLVDILKDEAVTLSREFKKASSLGEGTSQEIADFREHAVQAFLSRFFPNPYRVVKGKVHDSFGNGPSASIDCVLINPVHPHLIDSHKKFQVILADGVDWVLEVKPDLANAHEMQRALKQCISIKKLRRVKGPILIPQKNPQHVIEASKQIPFFLFTQKIKSNLKNTVREILEWYKKESVPKEEQIDALAIQDSGIVNHVKHRDFFYYDWQLPENEREGWFFESWGEATLLGLLLRMEMSFGCTATVQESVLGRYYKKITIPYIDRIIT
jgi:hypothetical protein